MLPGDDSPALVGVLVGPAYSARTEGWASLACKNKGSSPSPESISTTQARVPTLPTPTTLRATWPRVNSSSSRRRSDCRVRRYLSSTARSCALIASACTSAKTSSIGTIIGGSLMICRRLSTTVVSLPSA